MPRSRRTVFGDLERTGAGHDGLAREPAEHAGQGEEAEQRGHSECGQGADHARHGGGVPVFTPPPPWWGDPHSRAAPQARVLPLPSCRGRRCSLPPAIGATGLSDGPRAADDGQPVVDAASLELRGAGHIRDIGQPDAGQGRQQLIPQAARAASGSIHIWRPLRNSVGATHASPLRHASSTPPSSTELDSCPVSSTGQALRRNDGGFCKGLYMRVAADPSGDRRARARPEPPNRGAAAAAGRSGRCALVGRRRT